MPEIKLKSSRLTVEIAAPGIGYTGARFDRGGFITQVTLDGAHTFCVPESLDGSGTGGIGICNEFGIGEAIGYDETPPGGLFPKIGVGLLKRPDGGGYFFGADYEIIPFKIAVSANGRSAVFTSKCKDCNGYGFAYEKRVTASENTIVINYRLENTGAKPIHTQEYCHNFFGFDGRNISKGCFVTLSQPVSQKSGTDAHNVVVGENTIFRAEEPSREYHYSFDIPGAAGGFSWRLTCAEPGVAVSEHINLAPAEFALWGTRHAVSPEIFIDINLTPGGVKRWTRTFKFENL